MQLPVFPLIIEFSNAHDNLIQYNHLIYSTDELQFNVPNFDVFIAFSIRRETAQPRSQPFCQKLVEGKARPL